MAKKTDKGEPGTEPRFEDALAELEAMVRRLEQGELPLEESLVAFERGMGLVKDLTRRLEDIERRVEVLVKQDDGSTTLAPFTDDDEA
jgi:exodeoxyribonuclease VII small subunit